MSAIGKVEITRDKWTLWLCVGLPYSGKSTWARKRELPIVCPDAIRVAIHGQRFVTAAEPYVWATAYAMTEALFLAGHKDVIIDATNVTAARRLEWEKRYVHVIRQVFDTSPAECARRARDAGDEEILPIIDRMVAEWDLPFPESWKIKA